jgi:hypothetical protein
MIAPAPHALTCPPAITAIHARLAYLAAMSQVAANALGDAAALDLCPGSLDAIARELDTLGNNNAKSSCSALCCRFRT